MNRLLAITTVVAWSGFWAFGYLALSAENYTDRDVIIALILAFAGFGVGIAAYLKLARESELSGYAKASRVLSPQDRDRAQALHPLKRGI